MAVIERDSAVAQRLAAEQLAWLTTVRADGQPQTSYVWFHFDGTDLLLFSQPGTPKVGNVAANPRVSFHLNGDSSGGNVVTIEGMAEILDAAVDLGRAQAYLAKYDEPIRTQLNTTPGELQRQFSQALRITPARVRSW
jgi:PPOX class probable F420-dependent enzyme